MSRDPQPTSHGAVWLARSVATGVLLLAALVLAGWLLDKPLLKSGLPGHVAMKANTAIGLALVALALWLLEGRTAAPWRRRVVLGCALVVAALGAVSLAEYLLGTNLGIDQLFFREPAGAFGTSDPGRMAPMTAVNFVLLGTALWLVTRPRAVLAAQAVGVLIAEIGLLNLIGYLYEAEGFYRLGPYTPMAVPAAAAFAALGVGVLCVRPDAGLMRTVTGDSAGGLIVRRLLVPATLVPVAIEWLGQHGQRAGLYDHAFGAALTTAASTLMLAAVIWWTARLLERVDRERQRVGLLLRQANEGLESNVRERTAQLEQASLAARESEERFRGLFENSVVGIYRTTLDGDIQIANQALADMLGYSSVEELTQRNLEQSGFEPDYPRVQFRELMERQGYVRGLESAWKRRDGTTIIVRESARRIRDRRGENICFEGTVEDVTERKRAEGAEARLVAILEVTPDLVSLADPEGRLIYLNRAGRKMLGIDGLADLTGYNVQEFHDAANPQVVLIEGIPTAMREGAWSGETELVALDGHAIAVSQVILAHKAPNGTVAFLSTIARDITERRRGEAARRENDQRLQVALSGIKMAVFHQDRALRYTWMHQPQLAYSPDRVVGRTDAELLPPEAARQVTEIKQRVLETGARVREEVSVVADGATLVFDLVAEPLLDASGEIIGLTGATLDITERKQAEDALAHREAELRESQRIAGIGSWEWTIATGVVAWSEGMNHVLGRGLDLPAPTFETLASFYTPESWERLGAAIARTIETGAPYELELEMIRADGATCWTTTRGEAIRGADGTVVKLRGTVHDITKRRQAEADLRMQSAALHAAADAIVITDRAGVIEWVNPAFTQLTGYPAQDALGKNPKDLVKSGKHAPAFYREFWETLLAGRTWHGEMINRRKDGSLYTEEQTVTPIFGASGAILHFVAIKEDITERLQLEAQFRQAQKMESVGQLASGIAHDFNNLLTVINGMSELVLEQEASHDGPLYADVQEIRRAGERAATLTRQLLAFSRQQILEPRVLNVHTVVAGMESLLRRLLGEDIDLVVVPTPDASCVKADPGQLEQVITNLAVNARDAMPQGGRLTIETQTVAIDEDAARQQGVAVPLGPYVLLAVSDSGVGMDEATRVHIFEPFFTTKGPGKGTGLGLSTVYGIVKQSQGFIRVESEVGQGTSFKILLPQVTEAAGPERPGPTVVSSSGTETILLVEDNAGLRKLATRLLEPAGYIVFGAATGEEALRLLEGHEKPVHLLLSDVVLPGMNGRRLAEQLAQTHPGIKVLYMSGYTSDTIVRHGVLEARMPFLTKPFTAAALLRKVREVLDS